MSPPLKKLPIGIQTFSEIITEGYAYVDKTAHALALANGGKYYFLSRPRRFGKSLFLDTLKDLFEGREALFRGLAIHPHWDWSRRHPVIRIDFAGGVVQTRAALDLRIGRLLRENAERLGVDCDWTNNDIPGCFGDLIRAAQAAHGSRVAILVDEYDKPILDNIDRLERAAELREGLKNLYSTMKAQDAHIQFETGSPSFLIKLLQQRRAFLPELEGIEASEEILDSFDIERIDPVTLLFQTGYLTIAATRWRRSRRLYRLRLPNQEVKMALADHLIDGYLGTLPGGRDAPQDALYVIEIKLIRGQAPRESSRTAPPDAPLPGDECAPDPGQDGGVGNPALAQIRARGYSAKYRGLPGKGLFEVGLVFDSQARNLVQADWVAVA